MILDPATVFALAVRCAPAAAPETLLAVAYAESGLNPFALGVNRGARPTRQPTSRAAAVAAAEALLASGANVDLGLGQINSSNLSWLGLSVEAAFDPCRNLAASARVLQAGYDRSGPDRVGEQAALRAALSFYNTGSPVRGFTNGYVAKVANAALRIVPAIQSGPRSAGPPMTVDITSSPPAWDVFRQVDAAASFVVRVSSPAPAATGGRN